MEPSTVQNSELVDSLLKVTLLGAEWVLWLLIALSVISLAVIFERVVFFWKKRQNYARFSASLETYLNEKNIDKAVALCSQHDVPEAVIALSGLKNMSKGIRSVETLMEGVAINQKQTMDRGLIFLGTLGNNAPFVGLFGTVIGIIKAFHDLATNPQGGPSVVMQGISEALVATAIGLVVAIPAVVAFNTFNRFVKTHLAQGQATIKTIISHMEGEQHVR